MKKLDRIIKIIRELKEESTSVAPTNSSNAQGLGFDPKLESPPVKKKNRYIYSGKNSRSRWMSK
jgi:hypothetical protein